MAKRKDKTLSMTYCISEKENTDELDKSQHDHKRLSSAWFIYFNEITDQLAGFPNSYHIEAKIK